MCITVLHFNLFCLFFTQEASEIQPESVDSEAERFRADLDKAAQEYIKEHYPDGVATVSFLLVMYMYMCICN